MALYRLHRVLGIGAALLLFAFGLVVLQRAHDGGRQVVLGLASLALGSAVVGCLIYANYKPWGLPGGANNPAR